MKKKTRSSLVKELDAVYSQYIRLRDSDSNWYVTCFCCGTKLHWKDAQNMHFITRACYTLRRDDKNCFAGCKRCNVFLNGNYIEYTRNLIDRFGVEYVDHLRSQRHILSNISTADIIDKIEHYKQKVSEII